MAEEKLLTPVDVAKYLQINERTVTLWLRQGYLRGFKLGKEWRISNHDLRSFIAQHANKLPQTAHGDQGPQGNAGLGTAATRGVPPRQQNFG